MTWLYSRKTAETVTYLGGYICNREIHKDIGLLGLYPWLEDMEGVFKPGWRFYTHEKNPAFNEFIFEDILGKALRSIASGIEDVDSALKKPRQNAWRHFHNTDKFHDTDKSRESCLSGFSFLSPAKRFRFKRLIFWYVP